MQKRFTKQGLQGTASLLGATMLYGIFGIMSRYIGYNLPLFYQSWVRVLIASAILAFSYRSWIQVSPKDWPWFGVRAVAGVAAFLLFFVAVNAIPVNITYFIFYGGSTLGGFVLGAFMFKERTTLLRLGCLTLAVIGLALVYNVSRTMASPLILALAFASGLCTSLWSTLSKKIAAYPAVQMTFLDNALCFPIHIVLSLVMREPWPLLSFTPIQGANVLLGALFAVTGLLMVYGFRRLDAQVGSLIMLSEILFAILYGYLFFREVPAPTAAVGGILIVLAMVLPEINWKTIPIFSYAHRRKTTG